MTSGYSGTPLPTKIGVKPGQRLYVDLAGAAPVPVALDSLDLGDVVTRLPRTLEVSLLFTTRRAHLESRLPVLIDRTTPAGMVWVCWPKKAAKAPTDLDENVVREVALAAGVVDVKVAAIDETWSGLKLVRRLVNR